MNSESATLLDELTMARAQLAHNYENAYLTPLIWTAILTERVGAAALQARYYTDANDLFHVRLRQNLITLTATAMEAVAWLDER